jgi:hypothetical protein
VSHGQTALRGLAARFAEYGAGHDGKVVKSHAHRPTSLWRSADGEHDALPKDIKHPAHEDTDRDSADVKPDRLRCPPLRTDEEKIPAVFAQLLGLVHEKAEAIKDLLHRHFGRIASDFSGLFFLHELHS